MFASPRPVRPVADTANGADGISDIEGKAARGSSERVRATSEFQWSRRDASDIDGLSREAEWSFWEKRHRRQNCQGSSERVGEGASFKGAGASKSICPLADLMSEVSAFAPRLRLRVTTT